MNSKTILMFALLVSAPGVAQAATDLSRCVMNVNGQPLPYSLGSDGNLVRPKSDPNLSYYHDDDSSQTAVLKVKGFAYPSGSAKITTVLQKVDGKPSTVTVTMGDAKDKSKMFFSSITTYAYNGDKCYVAETSAKTPDQTNKTVDMVLYNKEMCDQVLASADKLSASELQKCSNVFEVVQLISRQFEANLAKEGRKMSIGEMGMTATYSPNWEPSALDVISNCKGNRYFYPVNGIPASNTYPVRGIVGGFPPDTSVAH